MKARLTVGLFLLCAGLALPAGNSAMAAHGQSSVAHDASRADAEAIHQTIANFTSAWNKHDAHAFAMTFTEDADFTNVAGVHARGRANVESFHASRFSTNFKDSHQTAAIRSVRMLTPLLAAVDVEWEMTGAKAPDGASMPYRKGLLDWVMAKQKDGRWLVEVMHNTDLTSAPAHVADTPLEK